ncbi:MAG: DctP family TRAP transporter solute-binding subunit [Synergistales bacterium]|nr:DctP family TRAP transporter solute-binding subunit [Synergistales bacterium]
MSRFTRVMFIAVVCLVALATTAVAAETVTLKLGHIADPKHPYAQGAVKFAELVEENSEGAMKIEVFPSSQLGNQRDLVEGLTLGTVDMTLTSTAVLGNFLPQVAVFDLPFIFRGVQHAYKALDTVGMEIAKDLEDRGIKVLAFMENGVRNMTNDVRPIKTPADMEGLKIRVMEQPIYIEMMKALDANPTPMAFSELFTALQKGVVDGQENPAAHIYTKRFFEVQDYISLTQHTYAAEPLCISMITWNKLDPHQQEVLKDAAWEAHNWQRQLARELENEYWTKIRESGKSEIIGVEEIDHDAFVKATKPVWVMFEEKVGKDNIEAILAIED